MKKPIIYLDMDEVIVNLSEHVIKLHNEYFKKDFDYKQNKSYWWKDTGTSKEWFKYILNSQGTFLNALPTQDSIKYINLLFNEGYEIYIVTYPQFNQYCFIEKINWIRKYLPIIKDENIIFTCQKHLLARNNTILYDDNTDNLKNFEEYGGISVARPCGWTKYNKRKAKTWKDFYDLVHKITDDMNSININNGIDIHNCKIYYENKLHDKKSIDNFKVELGSNII